MTMGRIEHGSDALWMLETIIDDFAQSLAPEERVRFYAEITELLTRRRDSMDGLAHRTSSEPDVPPQVH